MIQSTSPTPSRTDFPVVLIGLYNYKVLGVRYLASRLESHGFPCDLICFKNFESGNMKKPSEQEYALLLDVLSRLRPRLVGISVMSSLYMEAAVELTERIRRNLGPAVTIVWGGVYPTLFPRESLNHADLVMRGESDDTIVELMETLAAGKEVTGLSNLAYRGPAGEPVLNPLRPLIEDLDRIDFPRLGGDRVCYINHDRLQPGDPFVDSPTFEMTCSRGCPYVCSYCSNLSLRKMYAGQGKFVRLRSVDNVMRELHYARSRMKKMRMVIFWDEVFPDEPDWVNEFARRYRQEIGLPFQIWGHPLRTRSETIVPLVEAGLAQAVVGIQSGSPRIRKKVFFRPESQESIIAMSQVLSSARVPEIIYDLILDHPFEEEEDFRLTLELCEQLHHPFGLQLHGLTFLPGTAIVDLAIKQGVVSQEEMDRLQSLPLEDQYRSFYWFYGNEQLKYRRSRYWMNLIYFTQFPRLYRLLKPLAGSRLLEERPVVLDGLKKLCTYYLVGRRISRKARWLYVRGKR